MKQVTMICTLVFDVEDSVDVEKVKGIAVELINQNFIDSNLDFQPQIDPESPMVVTSISNPHLEEESIWSNIETNHEDEEEGLIYVDGYVGDEEEGRVLARINRSTGVILYNDVRARSDAYAQRMIQEVLDEIAKD